MDSRRAQIFPVVGRYRPRLLRKLRHAAHLPLSGGLELAVGAFDNRDDLAPKIQVNYSSHTPWVTTIFDQPILDDFEEAKQEMIISFQHPDHETETWPPNNEPPENTQ
jgi:hypothetical protein